MSKRVCASQTHAAVKRPKLIASTTEVNATEQILHPLLAHCYPKVKSLKDYLLAALPASSRIRRKRLLSFLESSEYAHFLTTTLVGWQGQVSSGTNEQQLAELTLFTQTCRTNWNLSAATQQWTIDEVIEFVVWTLFRRCNGARKRPNHILCHGLERSTATPLVSPDVRKSLPPGIIQLYSNPCRDELLKPVWNQIMFCLGIDGLFVLATLFLDCGLFISLEQGTANYRQLSGTPIHDLRSKSNHLEQVTAKERTLARRPSEIRFSRHRILYGKPSQNRQGVVCFGFARIHVLNRLSHLKNVAEDADLMRYLFPRQFKLHNVFTSSVDRRETAQQFKDYTTRDNEIGSVSPRDRARLPPRLRGNAHALISRLRMMHQRCSYAQIIYHYCPIPDPSLSAALSQGLCRHASHVNTPDHRTQIQSLLTISKLSQCSIPHFEDTEHSFLPYSLSTDQVSAFCRSVFVALIPSSLFGVGEDGRENWRRILSHVDRFVRMRKFESLSLHDVCQGLKMKSLQWLVPKNVTPMQKLSVTDIRKREELLHELVYYLFDSLLIPLLNSNFYITESGIHRNRLLYFRHDVWERLCQPTLASLRLGALTRLKKSHLRSKKLGMAFGYSTVRFLPKDIGTRPIANLRRRAMEMRDGKQVLALSTNERLSHIFSILNFERQDDQGIFRSDSFSLQTLGERLSRFSKNIQGQTQHSLYFVKVDIQSAFDSIPQEKMLGIANELFKHDLYYTTHHAEGRYQRTAQGPSKTNAVFRFVRSACASGAEQAGVNLPVPLMENKKHLVYSDVGRFKPVTVDSAKTLLEEHVRQNIVKVGRHLYRKKEGIAQGSILSSLLCTFFYNDFEMEALAFLHPRNSILLRIMDDFLLITLDRADALQFILAMKAGNANYGIRVHPEKSLVNFDVTIDGVQIPKLAESTRFPFCGLFIDTTTLQVSKNRVRKDNMIMNSLTVDLHGQAGARFKRRIMSSLRIQLQKVVLNRDLNDKTRVAHTVVESIQETTMKMHQYCSNMPAGKRPRPELLVEVIRQLMSLTTRMVSDGRQGLDSLTRSQIHCLVAVGMISVLRKRNSNYPLVLAWLQRVKTDLVHHLDMSQNDVDKLVDCCFKSVQHYHF